MQKKKKCENQDIHGCDYVLLSSAYQHRLFAMEIYSSKLKAYFSLSIYITEDEFSDVTASKYFLTTCLSIYSLSIKWSVAEVLCLILGHIHEFMERYDQFGSPHLSPTINCHDK